MPQYDMKEILRGHFRQIGLPYCYGNNWEEEVKHYKEWCSKNGLTPSTNKTPTELKKERETARVKIFSGALKANNKIDPDKPFKDIAAGVPFEKITWKHSGLLGTTHCPRQILSGVLLKLSKDTRLLEYRGYRQGADKYVIGVLRMLQFREFWIRPFEDWEPKSHNVDRQFAALARHLFSKYEVPRFMDSAWTEPYNQHHVSWFISIGTGSNIRKEIGLPFPLTKAMAHHFLQAPDDCTIDEALFYGQAIAEGADARLFNAMRGTRLRTLIPNEFKLSAIRFIVNSPMLDTSQIGPMMDYVHNQKYVTRIMPIGGGLRDTLPPEEPNFSFQGRTAETLIGQVERWHRQLGKEKKSADDQFWEHSYIRDFELEEGVAGRSSHKVWKIIQLLDSAELRAEGRTMKHCVASYTQSCASGRISIWSMTLAGERKLTIEVANQTIGQVRGFANRFATQQEKLVLTRWATRENLNFSKYY